MAQKNQIIIDLDSKEIKGSTKKITEELNKIQTNQASIIDLYNLNEFKIVKTFTSEKNKKKSTSIDSNATYQTKKENKKKSSLKELFSFDYVNEIEFKKLERSLKKYTMLAYKKLYFEYYPELKYGKFPGNMVSQNKVKGTKTYELGLPTDNKFEKIYGKIKLHYTVYEKESIVMLNTITPEDILLDGHQELVTFKGVLVSKEHSEKDMFKINLLNMLQK